MTNALLNERKEQLEERLINKDRELAEHKVRPSRVPAQDKIYTEIPFLTLI